MIEYEKMLYYLGFVVFERCKIDMDNMSLSFTPDDFYIVMRRFFEIEQVGDCHKEVDGEVIRR